MPNHLGAINRDVLLSNYILQWLTSPSPSLNIRSRRRADFRKTQKFLAHQIGIIDENSSVDAHKHHIKVPFRQTDHPFSSRKFSHRYKPLLTRFIRRFYDERSKGQRGIWTFSHPIYEEKRLLCTLENACSFGCLQTCSPCTSLCKGRWNQVQHLLGSPSTRGLQQHLFRWRMSLDITSSRYSLQRLIKPTLCCHWWLLPTDQTVCPPPNKKWKICFWGQTLSR